MDISEKAVEDLIFAASLSQYGQDFLYERGLLMTGIPYRQVNLGAYGIADIVTISYNGREKDFDLLGETERTIRVFTVEIFELKKDKIGLDALLQVCRYEEGIKKWLEPLIQDKRNVFHFSLNLIGSRIDKTSDFVYVLSKIRNLNIYQYSIRYDGLHFESIPTRGWSPTIWEPIKPFNTSRKFFRRLINTRLD